MSDRACTEIGKLQRLVERLRAPDGCPWDREQKLEDVRAYLLEEAHETAAAIDGGDRSELASELGDLLFQVVFVARLAQEEGSFDLGDVIERVRRKMVERHPHVFGDERLDDARAVSRRWESRKLDAGASHESLLGGVPASLPALTGAYRMTQKAAAVGFDWPDAPAVLDKVREELAELEHELEASEADRDAVREELGDLLFAIASLARHLELDPEAALARGNRKFRRRFTALERILERRGRPLDGASLAEMDDAWEEAKRGERESGGR